MLNDLSCEFPILLQKVIEIAKEAGRVILPYYQKQLALDVQHKQDRTPLTAADLKANQVLVAGLQQLVPCLPVLSEEGICPSYSERLKWDYYWLVDPLDGTRGFVNGSAEFTVNVALIERTRAVMGVMYAPVNEICYYAHRLGGAFKQLNQQAAAAICTSALQDPMRVVLGRYHKNKYMPRILESQPNYRLLRLNSSLKFGVIAEGVADIYPRLGPTSEWDTAAGQCILEEAGGLIVDLNGESLQYNAKSGLANPEFIALGDPTQLETLITLFQQVRREK